MNHRKALPDEFKALEAFSEQWSVKTAFERAHLRDTTDAETHREFYHAVFPLLNSALDYLDRKPLSELSAEEENLMRLLMSYAHVSMAVELQKGEEQEHAKWRPFMKITRAVGDG